MKKTLIGILALLVLAIAAVLIAPGFIDWNSYKSRIAAEAMSLTGRAVRIDGDISLRIVPTPELAAARVRVANAAGGSEADMATLEQLQIRVALWPLLKGRIQVESISLVEPRVLLEVYADGRNNWSFGSLADPAANGGAAEPGSGAPERAGVTPAERLAKEDSRFRIDRLALRDATILYRDAGSGIEERLDDFDAEVAAGSLVGPFSLKGTARYRGHDVEFETASGRWIDNGATPISITVSLPRLEAEGQFTGAVSRHAEAISLRGKTKLNGANLSRVLSQFSAQSAEQAALSKPFRVEANISADSDRLAASELILALADAEIGGEVEFIHRAARKVRVTLNASRLDLDSLLLTEEASGGGESPAGAPQGRVDGGPASSGTGQTQTGTGLGFSIPKDLEGSIQLVVDAAIYRNQVLRQMLFSADVTDGRLVIGEAVALLPGGSDIAMSGVLSTPPEGPSFDGRVDGAADNLRGVLQWLGIEVGNIPADRLRKTTFSTRVTATPKLVTLSDLDLRVDVTRINGGISAAVRDRPGLGVGLAIDRLDLDAYLPENRAGGPVSPDRKNGAVRDSQSAQSGPVQSAASERGDAEPRVPDLSFLDAFDANLDLRLGSLVYQGVTLRDLHLDGTLQSASLMLRSLDVADVAGGSFQASGQIDDLTGQPGFDGRIAVTVDNPSRLEVLLGREARVFERLGPFSLNSTLLGSVEDFTIDGMLQARGGYLSAAGPIRLAAPEPGYDLEIDAQHPDFAGLLRVLVPDAEFGAGTGPFSIAGQLSGTGDIVRFADMTLRVGSLRAEGLAEADFSDEVPVLNVELSTGAISTGEFTSGGSSAGSKRTSGSNFGSTSENEAQPAREPSAQTIDIADVHLRWSRDPIDLSGLAEVDGEFVIASEAILIDDLRIDDARIEATLNGGILSVRRFEGGLYGGVLRANGTLDGRDVASLDMEISSSGLDAGRLVRDLTDSDRVAGVLDVSATLRARGSSEAALVRSLAGHGRIGGELSTQVRTEEQIGNVVLGILGSKIKEIKGVSDATSALFGTFAGAPADLSGTFTVNRGIAATDDTRIKGRTASVLTTGTADLPSWLLASRSDLFRGQDGDQKDPYITAEVKGPMDEPNVRIGGRVFKRSGDGGSGTSSSSGKEPSGGRQLKSEEALRGLLKELVR